MTVVLRAKHWQIFLLFIGLLLFGTIARPLGELADDLAYLIFITTQIGWILALGFELNNRCNPKRAFWPIMTIGLVMIVCAWIFRLSMDLEQTAAFIKKLETYEWFAILLSSIVSTVMVSAFPAKALKLIELNGDVDINDYFNDFLSILFWPIGIWFIQPRINRIIDK